MKVLERDFDEKISSQMRMAILTAMSPASIQEFIYQQGDALTDYSGMVDRVRTLVRNRVAVGASKAHVGLVEEEEYDWDSQEIDAVGASTQCYGCGGWGHISRGCPYKGEGKGRFSKGAGKQGAYPNGGVLCR